MKTTVREYFDNNPARMDLGGIVPVQYKGDKVVKWIKKDELGRLSVWIDVNNPNVTVRTEIGLDASDLILEGIELVIILHFEGKDYIYAYDNEANKTDDNGTHGLF